MVRETRHLWVGNLPDNIREDRIREHFKRYGRVQNVKLLGRTENASALSGGSAISGCGICATVAFMDIKSASKAHNAEHVLDDRTLTTEYYEPAAIPTAAGAPSAGSSPAGSGYSGSSSSVNSAPNPPSTSRYHLSGGEDSTSNSCAIVATAAAPANWRGTNDSATDYCRRGNTPVTYGRYQRKNSTAPYNTPPSNIERTTPHHRWYASGERTSGGGGGGGGGESTPSTPGGADSGRRRRPSGSGSSRSESSSPEPSDTSRASTPAQPPPHTPHHNAHRTPPGMQHQWASTASGRPLAICVRNLPTRSTDSSLKDGLYHEYKKHGKVVWVKVVGQNADRYAVVRFKKPSDVEKALEVSQDKLFFGCKISVAPHQSCDEDADSAKPYETDIDEYHPKATRTLFIGNLEKDVTQQQLRDKFKHFGRIIEIDIKKGSGGGAGYAFCQYASISSVVEAIRAMDGEYVGGSRVKLGFGKPVATTCVWVDGLTEHTEKQVLGAVSRCGAATSVCVDRAAGAALVHFEQAAAAGAAVRELRRVAAQASAAEPDHPRLCVDYASRECQDAFYEQLEKHGGSAALSGTERLSGDAATRYTSTRHDPLRYESCGSRSRASSYGRGSSRTPRYSTLEHYDSSEYATDRRYRVYDEVGSSPQTEDAPYEDRLQSVVVSPHRARKHRRDSSPEDRKHSKERHRSASGTTRRSRSGSRSGVGLPGTERHATRRRHRRRRDGSSSRGSRAGTPLRDELDAAPAEPRRPPRERPPLPMSLPLPKFAAQLLRSAAPAPRPSPAPALAPASPPRPPSASSSSGGEAPHEPSLEERIRSLDEKYEKWSGCRALADAPDRSRLRHRLLEVDINEVKPSDVVRSLLAKRSVFDEDSERLEGAVRAPSPASSPRARAPPVVPRALRYPFPVHPPPAPTTPPAPGPTAPEPDSDASDRPADPRLNRPERTYQPERLGKFNESDYKLESRIRLRTPSTDKPQSDTNDRKPSPKADPDRTDLEGESWKDVDRRKRDFLFSTREIERKLSVDLDQDVKEGLEKIVHDYETRTEKSVTSDTQIAENSEASGESLNNKKLDHADDIKVKRSDSSNLGEVFNSANGSDKNSVSTDELSDKKPKLVDIITEKLEFKIKTESTIEKEIRTSLENESKVVDILFPLKTESVVKKENPISNHIKKEILEAEVPQSNHLNNLNHSIKTSKDFSDLSQELIKATEKNGKERYNQNIIFEAMQNNKNIEKENIEFDKCFEKEKYGVNSFFSEVNKVADIEKTMEDRVKTERDKTRHKDRPEKHEHSRDKTKNNRNERGLEKHDKDKKTKDETCIEKQHADKVKVEKDGEKLFRDKNDKESEKNKHHEEKYSRHDHHKKDKYEKDRKKECVEIDVFAKSKKDDKTKYDRPKKDGDLKRDTKKEIDTKVRKSSRDESSRDLCRKDSTDSSTSRASQDSTKLKESDGNDNKDESKNKSKLSNDLTPKHKSDKEMTLKFIDPLKLNPTVKIKTTDIKDEKLIIEQSVKTENSVETTFKSKPEITEKQRHYSLDSPGFDAKRKERLNSCSSLPSQLGHKRRMSSQDTFDFLNEDNKKSKNENKGPDRRDSKDLSRGVDRHKTTKFSKGYFAKIIESKTKDDKKTQVKPPDEEWKENNDIKDKQDKSKPQRRSPKEDSEDKLNNSSDTQPEGLHNDLDFLATLELRSSEEDERQKALRKEMKEKKRIQQLQQIQELEKMKQQDGLQLGDKNKDDKKQKHDEKKKEAAREKRMSTDRKSRDEKADNQKRKNRKLTQSTDTSDSDEPKKHSIFDIVDEGPTYISMYDKVKARSCKNMQKQEEEKRQEKIKAKFSQLKQSRAKREEKKRSSWDEDSDSENDGGRRRPQKLSMDSSSEEEQVAFQSKKREKSRSFDYDRRQVNEFLNITSTEEDTQNKLSRKNSRSRIISDTSDDEMSKRRSISKSPNIHSEIKKERLSDSELLNSRKDDTVTAVESSYDKIKKTSLVQLFGKSDSDDSKLKSSLGTENEYKPFFAPNCNDLSSESESMALHRHSGEVRKKHKKRQKKHKFSFSDDEIKGENNDGGSKHRHSDKVRRHSNKKDKRKDKIRESVEGDESRDEKNKSRRNKTLLNNFSDIILEGTSNNTKKEGKMEDIFGPLSDDSDKESKANIHKQNSILHEYDNTMPVSNDNMNKLTSDETRQREKDELKRKRDKKRKEKRYFSKEDENSLDVDAVSKAIEARLFADAVNDEDTCIRAVSPLESISKHEHNDVNYMDEDLVIETGISEGTDNMKRECREKKKKKKRSKEERQIRKEHHLFHNHNKIDKSDEIMCVNSTISLSPKTLSEIPMPSDPESTSATNKSDDCVLSETHSLPRLSDSPVIVIQADDNADTKSSSSTCDEMKLMSNDFPAIEIDKIPMPASDEPMVQDISEIPLPEDPEPVKLTSKSDHVTTSFKPIETDVSEDAVRSISNLEKEPDKNNDKTDLLASPVEEKVIEKPRAIISQEETADAVAALLGESFGEKENSFAYEENENPSTHQIEIESSNMESENIPEEDAEEMRQAVQNLNASEMEKPDTPVSDNDLNDLLIDTDTEEAEETAQDAIERLPVNIIATNQSLNAKTVQATVSTSVSSATSNVIISKPIQTMTVSEPEAKVKASEADNKFPQVKREHSHQITSTATPVITSWTLTNNKLIEPHILNIQPSKMVGRDVNENKPRHITANIVQIKAPHSQNLQINNTRPIISTNRMSAPYQVINHVIRPQTNMQPPTIKIPEPHILYQKPQGIVISPRLSTDPRLQSPKASPQGLDGMTSPRLTNMTILSTSPQNLNVGMASPNTMQQRSPGQVTVVRMQQPPLSPIQGVHIQHGARTMVSPNRPNSVLVQTQGAPIHFNRLPVTPVLAPISKQIKAIGVSTSPLLHQHKIVTEDGKGDQQRTGPDHSNTKIILSPTNLPPSTNPTVMAQNRLISMQNMHGATMNSPLNISNNKGIFTNVNQISEKRENSAQKVDQHNHVSFGTTPVLHVSGINHTSASIIQNSSKPVMCTIQETNVSRGLGSNVIHTISTPRVLTSAPITNVIQIDANKPPASVLSMATIRPPTVLTKLESASTGITTSTLTNVVMTPLLLKTSNAPSIPRINIKSDMSSDTHSTTIIQNHLIRDKVEKMNDKEINCKPVTTTSDVQEKQKDIIPSVKPPSTPIEHNSKCETDFEELLKDTTNEIKVTNDPEKKLEINVGKNVTLFTQTRERRDSIDCIKEMQRPDVLTPESTASEGSVSSQKETKLFNDMIDKEQSNIGTQESPIDKNLSEIKKELCEDTNETAKKVNPINNIFRASENLSNKIPEGNKLSSFLLQEPIDSQIKSIDENDSWSAKDVNIESVIKKVDSLCNEPYEEKKDEIKSETDSKTGSNTSDSSIESMPLPNLETAKHTDTEIVTDMTDGVINSEKTTPSKRGGRNVRGKRNEKNLDRVQTRQISKPARGGAVAKRGGRGRTKVDKKIKNALNTMSNNMPGDVYDFHEDSGDESATSPNKAESRPRLILTIKSPLGHSNAIATSTLSIGQKEALKNTEKTANKDEKQEDFVSPSPNTRKSRRLQEKDVQRSTVDDVIDDVIKGGTTPTKGAKEPNKKRATRQSGAKMNQQDKTITSDTRKSPRGTKRSRDRSLSFSDASMDSSDEKVTKKDDNVKDPKIPKLAETSVTPKSEAETEVSKPAIMPVQNPPAPSATPAACLPVVAGASVPNHLPVVNNALNVHTSSSASKAPCNPPVVNTPATSGSFVINSPAVKPIPHSAPTPIMKPPKKMISEKLAIESAATANLASGMELGADKVPSVPDKHVPPPRELRQEAEMAAATGEGDSFGRRPDGAPGVPGVPAAHMMPVGATEATDERVQSPALPHRIRPADRATPVLMRAGEGEGAGLRARYGSVASLPRGAHLPQPAPAPLLPAKPPQAAPHHPGAASRGTITCVPTISPQGQIALSDGMYPHFSPQHYQMYQQHFRVAQAQDTRPTPSQYPRVLEADVSEAPTPPLELRRPPSARVPRPAHSPSPADRHIMYAVGCGRSPPPAHGGGAGAGAAARLAGALPPPPGPPIASQVPREADSLQMLLRRYPVMWQGLLALKNDSAAVQMHFVGGSMDVAGDTLPRHTDGSTPPLRIAQRMRLEPAQLDQVHRKMKMENEHCILLALPCGRDHMDVLQQSTNLSAGFITYLQRKQAAGIVNVAPPGHHQAMYTVHIFPSCDFANENLNRIAPDLMHRVADIAHLLIVIATAP